MREAYDYAMAFNKLERAEEEEVLLLKEMSAYLTYFKQDILCTLLSKVQSKFVLILIVLLLRFHEPLILLTLKALMKF